MFSLLPPLLLTVDGHWFQYCHGCKQPVSAGGLPQRKYSFRRARFLIGYVDYAATVVALHKAIAGAQVAHHAGRQ